MSGHRKIARGLYEVTTPAGDVFHVDYIDWRPFIGGAARRPVWAVTRPYVPAPLSTHTTKADAVAAIMGGAR